MDFLNNVVKDYHIKYLGIITNIFHHYNEVEIGDLVSVMLEVFDKTIKLNNKFEIQVETHSEKVKSVMGKPRKQRWQREIVDIEQKEEAEEKLSVLNTELK